MIFLFFFSESWAREINCFGGGSSRLCVHKCRYYLLFANRFTTYVHLAVHFRWLLTAANEINRFSSIFNSRRYLFKTMFMKLVEMLINNSRSSIFSFLSERARTINRGVVDSFMEFLHAPSCPDYRHTMFRKCNRTARRTKCFNILSA